MSFKESQRTKPKGYNRQILDAVLALEDFDNRIAELEKRRHYVAVAKAYADDLRDLLYSVRLGLRFRTLHGHQADMFRIAELLTKTEAELLKVA